MQLHASMIVKEVKKIKIQTIILALTLIFTIMLCGSAAAANVTWHNETADNSSNTIGSYSSISVDSNGNPHISYYDDTNGNLMYASKNGTNWTTEIVDSTGNVGEYTSLALDNSGNPHISYYDSTNTALKHARWNGIAWILTTVDNSAAVGQYTSLALDSSGNPHISYYDVGNGNLKYARWNGTAWIIETVDGNQPTNPNVGRFSSLSLDGAGNPHIAYYDDTNHALKYASNTGSGWTLETVDNENDAGWDTSLALDNAGNPHISYKRANSGHVRYASKTGGVWTTELVDISGGVGVFTSLSFDNAGNPYISYYGYPGRSLAVSSKNGDLWSKQILDVAITGYYSSLVIDNAGNIHLSYVAVAGSSYYLKYANFILDPVISNDSVNSSENSTSSHVNAATNTVKAIGMQETGLPLPLMILALLMVLSGLIIPKKK